MPQAGRDVVEAFARIVGRQQARDVEGMPNRSRIAIGVFGAIQPMQCRCWARQHADGLFATARRAAPPARRAAFQHRGDRLGVAARRALLPGGGIIPARSLRTTFSHDSASSWTFAGSRMLSARPPAQSVVL